MKYVKHYIQGQGKQTSQLGNRQSSHIKLSKSEDGC